MTKRALLVGINYVGTGNELRGCINDSHNMQALLIAHGFDSITLMLEKEATTAGILAALDKLVTGVIPGDVIVFHYSGHGSQLPSNTEPDGFEEIICPIDLNWMDKVITDASLRDIFNKVPNGVNTTVILDCCHAGTGLDQSETYVIDTGPGSRYLSPPSDIVVDLREKTLVDWQTSKDINATAILVAACHANQTSADTVIDGMPQGAATGALIKSVDHNPKITYKQLITEMTSFMVTNKYTQVPQLDGSPALYDQIFIEPFSFIVPVTTETTTVPVTAGPLLVTNDTSNKKTLLIGGVVVALFLLVLIFL
jgi:hypothetical protein